MFKIGDFSKLTLVSIRMLRYYDEIDLFQPAHIDTFTNYRYYTATQIPTLKKIVRLRDLGFKTDDIRRMLNATDSAQQTRMLQEKKQEILKELEQQNWRLQAIDRFIQNYHQEDQCMKYDIIIRSIPTYRVVSLRDIIPTYMDEGSLWHRLSEGMHAHQLQPKPHGMIYAMFHDDEHLEQQVDVEIGCEIEQDVPLTGDLTIRTLASIEQAATVLVTGAYYPNIEQAFEYLATWLEDQHYEIAGPSRTVYIKGPANEEDPDNYLTEIILPIRPSA
jgi:DNA-binding transcriptional MerR regulator/effector-binding domain-containing protein